MEIIDMEILDPIEYKIIRGSFIKEQLKEKWNSMTLGKLGLELNLGGYPYGRN